MSGLPAVLVHVIIQQIRQITPRTPVVICSQKEQEAHIVSPEPMIMSSFPVANRNCMPAYTGMPGGIERLSRPLVRDLATDGLQIPAVTVTNAPLKPVEW
ncbi:hypothetical protein [Ktedonobacter sp. SOSP1-85]|uniref:hypothetical protein n=1 Tax=Ktedonobacter sp. SOSP1-85 TaxID=2778367 RepID=UPI001F44FED5|nr:hypothetical protein [Ktedonobacter sp. SOSP1-85]